MAIGAWESASHNWSCRTNIHTDTLTQRRAFTELIAGQPCQVVCIKRRRPDVLPAAFFCQLGLRIQQRILHRATSLLYTVLIIFPVILQTIITAQILSVGGAKSTGEELTKQAKSRRIQVEQGWYNYIDGNESTRAFARLLTDSLLSLLYDLLPGCAELHRERTDCSTERLNF